MAIRASLTAVLVLAAGSAKFVAGQPLVQRSAAETYKSACAACHGPDGRGMSRSVVGFETPLPDFTDCQFATPEADLDWIAVVHQGGKARAFDRMMPAFGDALSDEEIVGLVGYLRGFCKESGWPRGELNLPRPLVTEKAFPENEAVLTLAVSRGPEKTISNELLYERRVGRRGQWEAAVPIVALEADGWDGGIGDVAFAFKQVVFDSLRLGSIVSAGGEVVLPTGNEANGLGNGVTVVEPFGTFSQLFPRDIFLHAHAGLGLVVTSDEQPNEAFWRATVGRTWSEDRWGRTWSPMLELLGARELTAGEPALWDVVPQIQVSLSARQHVLLNAGVRVPLNRRDERRASVLVYLLWDWFDGGFLSGW